MFILESYCQVRLQKRLHFKIKAFLDRHVVDLINEFLSVIIIKWPFIDEIKLNMYMHNLFKIRCSDTLHSPQNIGFE